MQAGWQRCSETAHFGEKHPSVFLKADFKFAHCSAPAEPQQWMTTEGRALHKAQAAPAQPTRELQSPSATSGLALGLGDCAKGIWEGGKKKHSKKVQGNNTWSRSPGWNGATCFNKKSPDGFLFPPAVFQWSYSHNSSRHKFQWDNIRALISPVAALPTWHTTKDRESPFPVVHTNWFIIRAHPAPLFSDRKCVFHRIETQRIISCKCLTFLLGKNAFCFMSG